MAPPELITHMARRALVPTGGVAHIGKHLKTLRQKCPTSVALMVLVGHYQLSQVSHVHPAEQWIAGLRPRWSRRGIPSETQLEDHFSEGLSERVLY